MLAFQGKRRFPRRISAHIQNTAANSDGETTLWKENEMFNIQLLVASEPPLEWHKGNEQVALTTRFSLREDLANKQLAQSIASLINEAYKWMVGIFTEDYRRTSVPEVEELLAAGKLLLLFNRGQLVGTIRVDFLEHERAAMLGMFAISKHATSKGFGRYLFQMAEEKVIQAGYSTAKLFVLTPVDKEKWPAINKLISWYRRMGFVEEGHEDFGACFPHLRRTLEEPCKYVRWFKKLA